MFTSENAAKYGRLGGLAKDSFKDKAKAWVNQHGYETLIDWAMGKSERKATFAVGLLFGYAVGKPIEKIQIDDRKEVYIGLSTDPALNAIAARFGILPGRIREVENGSVVDGEIKIQTESTPTLGV